METRSIRAPLSSTPSKLQLARPTSVIMVPASSVVGEATAPISSVWSSRDATRRVPRSDGRVSTHLLRRARCRLAKSSTTSCESSKPSRVASARLAPVRLARERCPITATVGLTLARSSARLRSTKVRSARSKVKSVARTPAMFAPVKEAPSACVLCSVAPSSWAQSSIVPVRSTPSRVAWLRLAPRKSRCASEGQPAANTLLPGRSACMHAALPMAMPSACRLAAAAWIASASSSRMPEQ
mmetsp:Transcript_9549/g.31167  ORF Transcript_9549/g.31167 Transcript_9549/m.31167 type:complete len:241 (+) Transcript_9549:1046-1768(+)